MEIFDLLTFIFMQGTTISNLSVSITPVENYQLPPGALPSSPVNYMDLIILCVYILFCCFMHYCLIYHHTQHVLIELHLDTL